MSCSVHSCLVGVLSEKHTKMLNGCMCGAHSRNINVSDLRSHFMLVKYKGEHVRSYADV